jgi:anti-sigma B factor antagonist
MKEVISTPILLTGRQSHGPGTREISGMESTFLFRIETENVPGGVVLHLHGSLDAHTAPEFDYTLSRELAHKPGFVVLDLAGVQYISSAGFGSLLDGAHCCRDEGSRLRVASLSESVDRVFRMLGLNRVIERVVSGEDAVPPEDGTQA